MINCAYFPYVVIMLLVERFALKIRLLHSVHLMEVTLVKREPSPYVSLCFGLGVVQAETTLGSVPLLQEALVNRHG